MVWRSSSWVPGAAEPNCPPDCPEAPALAPALASALSRDVVSQAARSSAAAAIVRSLYRIFGVPCMSLGARPDETEVNVAPTLDTFAVTAAAQAIRSLSHFARVRCTIE